MGEQPLKESCRARPEGRGAGNTPMECAGNVSWRRFAWAWSLGLLLGAAGCTICPDPFDYSGPVPNGSAPQNDFRARANGIAPTGGVPRPWPPVVRGEADRPTGPGVVPTAVETDAGAVPTATADVILPAAAARDAAAEADGAVDGASPLDGVVPAALPERAAPGSTLSETPGWRPRD